MSGELGYFAIDPLLTVTDEAVLQFQSGIEHEAQLQHLPSTGTLRLWENRRFQLEEGTDFTIDYATGAITLLTRFSPNSILTADYRFAVESVGPVPFQWNTLNADILPGVVLAFGKRSAAGQRVAVVVYPDRVKTAEAYGGKFEVSFDMDVISRDPEQLEEIADLVIMYLWGEKRAILSSEGIEITEVSMGGESEDVADETSDLNYYQASMSTQMMGDWEIHIPLPLTISRVTPMNASGESNIQPINSDVFVATQPIIVDRSNDFERLT
jgi:hypothetical protein